MWLCLSIFGVPTGVEQKLVVPSRHDHGRGVSKTHRPHPSILISRTTALAVLVGERKAQAGRVDPALAELAQTCDRFDAIQFSRQTADPRKIAARDEAVAVLDRCDPPALGLPFHPFVTVQDHLRTKWRIAAHSDRDMAPLRIDQMKVEMPHERPF